MVGDPTAIITIEFTGDYDYSDFTQTSLQRRPGSNLLRLPSAAPAKYHVRAYKLGDYTIGVNT